MRVEFIAIHVVFHEVRPLVHVHADAVAEAMGEVLVAGTESAIDDDFAGRCVDVCRGHAGARGLNGRGLGAVDEIEDALHLVRRFSNNKRARDVGGIALDGTAVVEHEDAAIAESLRLARAVREGGEFVDVEAGFTFESDAPVCRCDKRVHVVCGHADGE